MNRWLWILPILVVLLSVTAFFYWGLSWTTAGLVALLMICPALMIWGAVQIQKIWASDAKVNVKKSGGKN